MTAAPWPAPVLVLGGTGQVGQAALRALAAADRPPDVRLLVRNPERLVVRPPAARVIVGAIEDDAALAAALRGAGAVLLVTGDSVRQAALETRVIDFARRLGRPHIVKISANTAGLDPPVSFGRGHAAVEARLRLSGLDHTLLRPTIFFQSIPRLFAPPATPRRLVAPTGRARIAFVHVADVGAAAAAALRTRAPGAATYELTGPRAYTLAEVAQALSARMGRRVTHLSPPAAVARPLMALSGAGWRLSGDLAQLFCAVRQGAQAEVSPDAEALTGRAPLDLDAWLDDVVPGGRPAPAVPTASPTT